MIRAQKHAERKVEVNSSGMVELECGQNRTKLLPMRTFAGKGTLYDQRCGQTGGLVFPDNFYS